jgi:hypothetical protein
MRLFAALAIVLVALLVATVRHATSKRRHDATPTAAPPTPDVADEVADDAPAPRLAPRPSYAAHASDDDIPPTGVAHLHGRLLPPLGRNPESLAGTTVIADDGVRSFNVQASEAGRFSFHLPPGRYELMASSERWSGSVSDVVARAGADRGIDIQLEQGATISGVLRGSPPVDAGVSAWAAGRFIVVGDGEVSGNGFEVTGLLPGRHYDLTIRSSGARTVKLREVSAPASHLDVELVPLPVVRGAFGFPRGDHCPIKTVTVTFSDDADANEDGDVGADCRFEIKLPGARASAATATIAATGSGWHVEQAIAIPAHGDPDPVCLNPPCRANPLEGAARMLVTMEGHDQPVTMVSARTDDSSDSIASCSDDDGCVLEALVPNRTYHVTASAPGCQEEVRDVTVAPGDNTLRFACRRQRKIQGLLRATGAPPSVDVRCTGGLRNVRHSRLFAITCAADDMALQYRVLPDGAWQSAAIPTAEDLPLVEIAL